MSSSLRNAGDAAPAFRLPNHDGVSVDLSAFRGRYLLLWWYPKAGTYGWSMEGKGFRDRIQAFSSRNTAVAGVSFDSPARNRAFREKHDFPFNLLSDEDRSVSMSYGAAKRPRQWFARRISYLIDPEGRIARVYGKVRPGRHPDEVLATLDEMGWAARGRTAGFSAEKRATAPGGPAAARGTGIGAMNGARAGQDSGGAPGDGRTAAAQRVTGGKGSTTRTRWAHE